MFDTNKFKRSVKDWVRANPHGSMDDLIDYCEELIPASQFKAYNWLVEQTTGWYAHILNTRQTSRLLDHHESEDMA